MPLIVRCIVVPALQEDGDRWRCVEWPTLSMQRDHYTVDGCQFGSLVEAVADAAGDSEFQSPVPGLNPSRTL